MGDPSSVGPDSVGTNAALRLEWSVMELGDGFEPSLALDANGAPAVSLAQGVPTPTNSDGDVTPVLFTNDGSWRAGTGWTSENLGIVAGNRDGDHNSLAYLGSTPQLAFTSRVRLDQDAPMILKFAAKTWTGWQVETLDDDGWIWQVVQRVRGGTTWVVYPDPVGVGTGVRIATRAGSGPWAMNHLPSIPHDLLNSIDAALAPTSWNTTLGIATTTLSAKGADPAGLHFAKSPDGGFTWGPVIHVDDTNALIGPQMAYSGLNPRITYSNVNTDEALYAFSDDGGLTWKTETIATFTASPATGLTIDPQTGEPVVAIVAANPLTHEDRLYVARRDGPGSWSLVQVDSVDTNAGYSLLADPRIVVTADGTVAMAYQYAHFRAKHVRFAWTTNTGIGARP